MLSRLIDSSVMAADDFDIVIEAMLEEPYKNYEDERQKNNDKNESEASRTHRKTPSPNGSRDHQSRKDQKSPSNDRRNPSNDRRSPSKDRRSSSKDWRSSSKDRRSLSKDRRSLSKDRRSLSKDQRSLSKDQRSLSKDQRSLSTDQRSLSKDQRSLSTDQRSLSTDQRSLSTDQRSLSKDQRSPSKDLRSRSKDLRSRSKDRSSRSQSHNRHRSRERRHRSREHRHRSRVHHHHSRSRERKQSHSRDHWREDHVRPRSPLRRPTPSIRRSPRNFEKSPLRERLDNLSPEERDARTVLCMQLAARIRPRDLEDFFSAVGKVRDVRIIADRNSRRSKGIAYVEFTDIQSVPLAIGLSSQRLLGVPIIVQASQAEKNRLAALTNMQRFNTGPLKLYVGNLHCNITEGMLRGIFEPFGKIMNIQLMKMAETGISKGFGFLSFTEAECARRALEHLNGFELAGRPIKVGYVTDRLDGGCDISFPEDEAVERAKALENARIQLVTKLVEGSGMQLPLMTQTVLQLNGAINLSVFNSALAAMNPGVSFTSQPVASECMPLTNVFQPQTM